MGVIFFCATPIAAPEAPQDLRDFGPRSRRIVVAPTGRCPLFRRTNHVRSIALPLRIQVAGSMMWMLHIHRHPRLNCESFIVDSLVHFHTHINGGGLAPGEPGPRTAWDTFQCIDETPSGAQSGLKTPRDRLDSSDSLHCCERAYQVLALLPLRLVLPPFHETSVHFWTRNHRFCGV